MLQTFEKHTAPLPKEMIKKVVPKVVALLKTARGYDWQGKRKTITNNEIRYYLRHTRQKIWVKSFTVRAIIHYIRVNGLVPLLLASGKGYFIAASKAEIRTYRVTLAGRNNSVAEIDNAIYSQSLSREARALPETASVPKRARNTKSKKRKPAKKRVLASRKSKPVKKHKYAGRKRK